MAEQGEKKGVNVLVIITKEKTDQHVRNSNLELSQLLDRMFLLVRRSDLLQDLNCCVFS